MQTHLSSSVLLETLTAQIASVAHLGSLEKLGSRSPLFLTVILFMDVSMVSSSSWSLKQKLCVNVPQHRLGFSSPARCWKSGKSCKRAFMYLPAQLLLGCLQLWRTGFDGPDAPHWTSVHTFRFRWFG